MIVYDIGAGNGRTPGEQYAYVDPDLHIGRVAGGWHKPEDCLVFRQPTPERAAARRERLLARLSDDEDVWRFRAADGTPLKVLADQAGVPVSLMREVLASTHGSLGAHSDA